jgi:hypothetical protein
MIVILFRVIANTMREILDFQESIQAWVEAVANQIEAEERKGE